MGLKGLGVGIDGAAVEAFGFGEPVLRVGNVACVEQGAGIGGILREVEIEAGFGGLPVGFADGGFGFGDLLCSRLRRRGNCGGRLFRWAGFEPLPGRKRGVRRRAGSNRRYGARDTSGFQCKGKDDAGWTPAVGLEKAVREGRRMSFPNSAGKPSVVCSRAGVPLARHGFTANWRQNDMRILKKSGSGFMRPDGFSAHCNGDPGACPGAALSGGALSDLRTARDYIKSDHRPEYDGQRHHALDEINKAIDEIKQAAWDDGKNTKWAPPASPVTDPWQPERMAANWLAEALKQLSTSEEQQSANHALQQRAIQHVAEARLAVGGLIRMSGH
jgi:hypothetical protein